MSCCGWCGCCYSLRGASFFATSIHIFIGLYFFVSRVVLEFVHGLQESYFEDEVRMQVIYPLVVIYIAFFIVFGCVNFLAVEKESALTLKWSVRLFILLQIAEILGHGILGFILPDEEDEAADHRMHHIKYMALNCIATSFYCIILLLYTRKLLKGKYDIYEYEENELKPTAPSYLLEEPNTSTFRRAPPVDHPTLQK